VAGLIGHWRWLQFYIPIPSQFPDGSQMMGKPEP
jgi:hypothetical protein